MTNFAAQAQLSAKTAATEESAILIMAKRARELREAGKDVLNLTIGEPDFDTPQAIKQAASQAMADGHTHYAPIAGIAPLRQAIADKYARENGVAYQPDEIVVSNGAKQSITNACFALLDPGDDVLLAAPFWAAYSGIAEMAGGRVRSVLAGADSGFKITPAQLKDALRAETKLFFLNNPGNPSGALYTGDELAALAQVIAQHPRVMVIADEIYEYIVFSGDFVSFAALPQMRPRTITINGVSKGFAMTGWRLGYAAAAKPVAGAIAKVQGTFTAGANAFVQHAAAAALNGPRDEVEAMRAAYHRRRDLIAEGLKAIPQLVFSAPPATFYAFADVSACFGCSAGNHRFNDSKDVCNWLLEEYHVATVPGIAFGEDRAIRLSFATGDDIISRALERMQQAFATIA